MFATLCEDEARCSVDRLAHRHRRVAAPTRAGTAKSWVRGGAPRARDDALLQTTRTLRLLVQVRELAVAEVLFRLVGATTRHLADAGHADERHPRRDNTGVARETTLWTSPGRAREAPETSDADGLFNSADTAQRRANAAEVLRHHRARWRTVWPPPTLLREPLRRGSSVSSNESAAMYGSRLDGFGREHGRGEHDTPSPRRRTRRRRRLVNVVDAAAGPRRGTRRRSGAGDAGVPGCRNRRGTA